MKVLFINQEISPYVPDGELSLMGNKLPHALQEKGCEIRTFMPKWGIINERRGQLHEVIRLSGMNIVVNETDHPLVIKVASIPTSRIQVYFIDNDDYFPKRKMTFDDEGKPYEDNGERAVFFARGVLETVKKLRWVPDVIHCQGWISAAVPFYIKTAYHDEPSFAEAKVVTSLYGDTPEGLVDANFKKCVEFRDAKAKLLGKYNDAFDYTDLAKLAIDFSDGVIEEGKGVSSALLDYATASGKSVLANPGDDFAAKYKDFYTSLCEK